MRMSGCGVQKGRGGWVAPGRSFLGWVWAVALMPAFGWHGIPVLEAQERPIPLDTIRVQVGSRASAALPVTTRSIQLLGREEIEDLPARSVTDLLSWAVGVEVSARSPAQADLSLRGAGFEQVVVLVNGVRMSDPQTGHFDLDLAVPLDQVERVEILRGPASALYGADAVGGVVNIVTRDAGTSAHARIEGGMWGTGRVSLGGGIETEDGLSVQGGGELARSDGHRPGTDFETTLLRLGLAGLLGGGRVGVDLALARRDFGADGFYAAFPSFERTRTYTGAVRWTSLPLGPLVLDAGASYRRHEDDFVLKRDDPAFYRNEHLSSQAGGEAVVRAAPWPGVDLAFGGEVFRDGLESSNLGDRTEDRAALMAEVVWGRGRPTVLSGGIRQDWHEGFGSFFSPSLSASHRVGAKVRLRSALGRSFRAPTWTERYYEDPLNVGREDLDPERAWSGEAGLDWFPDRGARVSITGFARRAAALIDWARVAAAGDEVPWETRNVERADFYGLEGEIQSRGPLQTTVVIGGSFLSVDTKESSGFRSKYALRPLVEQALIGVRRSFAGMADLSVNARRGKREGEAAFHRLDLRVGIRWGPTRVYLDATNLADARYPDITGEDAPGRAFFLGVELGWGG
jgi:iron complex outermembrane receptor protein